MEWAEIAQNFGFAVAMCAAMGYYIKYIEDKHREEREKFIDSINNNTHVLSTLCEKISSILDKEE